MTEPTGISKDEVLALHLRGLTLYGGKEGLRDEGLLESALGRPRTLFAYEKADLFQLAATYAEGLCNNHPFIDGNKRVAFYATYVFLRINGRRLQAPEAEVVRMFFGIADKSVPREHCARWLERHSRPVAEDSGPG